MPAEIGATGGVAVKQESLLKSAARQKQGEARMATESGASGNSHRSPFAAAKLAAANADLAAQQRLNRVNHGREHLTMASKETYCVTVATGGVSGPLGTGGAAGTDAEVFIQLIGAETGFHTEDIPLDHSNVITECQNFFEDGCTDIFEIECRDIGELAEIKIGHDDSSRSPDWFLDRVSVRAKSSGQASLPTAISHASSDFPCLIHSEVPIVLQQPHWGSSGLFRSGRSSATSGLTAPGGCSRAGWRAAASAIPLAAC